MNDSKFKHFNPMKLREKYTANKTNNYSSFWMNDDWDSRKTSIFDDGDEVVGKPKTDLVALAGYSKDDIELELKDSTLTVRNKKREKVVNEDTNGVIHKGISTRQFERAFTISEDIKIKNAELKNGLLNIDLERIIPEEKKPRKIAIEQIAE